jgi:hypothetical protein
MRTDDESRRIAGKIAQPNVIARCKAVLLVVATCATPLLATSTASAASDPAAVRQAVSLLDSQVTAAATRSGPRDPTYFDSGEWLNATTTCWSCSNGGLATAAATLWRSTGMTRSDVLQEATETIDTAIATRQGADGSFSPPPGSADGQPTGIATMFFGVEMGTTLLQLSPALDRARQAAWAASLGRAADYVIDSGFSTWYANGNINLGYVELLYLAWRATAAPRFLAAYEDAWSFVLDPPQDRFPGDGLRIVKQPSSADGSDGAGYLAENGPGGVGFDAEYSELQLDVACRLYVLSGDPRALRLANLLVNMLLARVDGDWLLDTSEGTRHTDPNRKVPFLTSALAVLGWRAGRADLTGLVASQLAATRTQYGFSWNQTNDVFRRALGNDVSVILLAADVDAPRRAVTLSGTRRLTSRGLLVTLRGTIRGALGYRRRIETVEWYRRHKGWKTVKTMRLPAGRFHFAVTLPRSAARHGASLRLVVRGVGRSATLRIPRTRPGR